MRTLVFTCGYESCYFEFANWFAHTVRYHGYSGDLIIFSTQDRRSPYAEVINVANHPDAGLLKTGRRRYFHSNIPRDFGHEYYRQPWDFFIIKTLPGAFIDRDKYDFILYCDSDILVRRPIDEVFEHATLVTAFNARRVYWDIKGLASFLNPDEVRPAKRIRGFGGGIIGVPRAMFDFYEEYREVYLDNLGLIPHDQPALSLCLFRNRDRYRPVHLDNTLMNHYWGQSQTKQGLVQAYRDFLRDHKQQAVGV